MDSRNPSSKPSRCAMRSRSSPNWASSPLIRSSSRELQPRHVLPYILPQPAIAGQDQPGQSRPYCQHRNQDAD